MTVVSCLILACFVYILVCDIVFSLDAEDRLVDATATDSLQCVSFMRLVKVSQPYIAVHLVLSYYIKLLQCKALFVGLPSKSKMFFSSQTAAYALPFLFLMSLSCLFYSLHQGSTLCCQGRLGRENSSFSY